MSVYDDFLAQMQAGLEARRNGRVPPRTLPLAGLFGATGGGPFYGPPAPGIPAPVRYEDGSIGIPGAEGNWWLHTLQDLLNR